MRARHGLIVGGRTPINRTQAGFWCRSRSPLTADVLRECQTKVVITGEVPARVSKGHTPSPRFLPVVNFHRVQFPNESVRTTSPVVDRIQALYRISKWHSFTPISHHRVPERLKSARLYTYWQCVQAQLSHYWQLRQLSGGMAGSRRVFLYVTIGVTL